MKIKLIQCRNQIIVEQPYFEMVRKTRHGFFAKFDVHINPNNDSLYIIGADDPEVERYIAGSKSYVENFFDRLNRNEISINGLTVHVFNNEFHAVDSKPVCFDVMIANCLRNLIWQSSTKRIVSKSLLKGNNYELDQYTDHVSFSNIDYELYYFPQSPILHKESIAIKYDFLIDICGTKLFLSSTGKFDWRKMYGSDRRLCIQFKNGQFSPTEKIDMYEVIRLIINDCQKQHKNLLKFIIYVEKGEGVKYLHEDFMLNFEWAIRNLLSNEDATEIRREDL